MVAHKPINKLKKTTELFTLNGKYISIRRKYNIKHRARTGSWGALC